MAPVAVTWVPPHALRSRPSMLTIRMSPERLDGFLNPVAEPASSNVTVTGRFSA